LRNAPEKAALSACHVCAAYSSGFPVAQSISCFIAAGIALHKSHPIEVLMHPQVLKLLRDRPVNISLASSNLFRPTKQVARIE
jgi:hypothetical protein